MSLKLHFVWASSARAELRKIERETAMRILLAPTRYGETGEGDVKALEGKFTGTHRLRVGDWRVRFRRARGGGAIHVLAVENRGEAY
jgi:mRNA-degrading endonuclease RelE of RelBE toxin-antitoxin system